MTPDRREEKSYLNMSFLAGWSRLARPWMGENEQLKNGHARDETRELKAR